MVDDIDRLQPSELFDLLKVVRLLGRFPGVDFLLAYDEQTLVEILQNSGQGAASKTRARAFMEKIVQYPLSIPPLLTSQTVGMLNTGLTQIVTPERLETGFDKHRFGDVILITMPRQLTTPRAIERFLAQVREQFRAHDLDEMNDVDLILATFLRVQFPDVFTQLQSWKSDLTRDASSYVGFRRDHEPPNWDALVDVLEREEDRRDAMAVLAAIFPAAHDKNSSRPRAGRFAHFDYFDRYLAQAIPEGDIPDAVVGRALDSAAAGSEDALRALLTGDDAGRVMLALGKIRARYPDVGEVKYHDGPLGPVTLDLLSTAMALIDEANDRLTSLADTSDQLRYWAVTLLRRLLDVAPAHDVDTALLKCTQIHRRAHLLKLAGHDLSSLKEETRTALSEALQREVDRIVPMLLSDLRAGDDSEGESGSPYLYELVADSPRLRDIQTEIADGLATNDFTLEDIAARFVRLFYTVGGSGRPSKASFAGEIFTKITGTPSRAAEQMESGEWPDTSWRLRRDFAKAFIQPAHSEVDATSSQAPRADATSHADSAHR